MLIFGSQQCFVRHGRGRVDPLIVDLEANTASAGEFHGNRKSAAYRMMIVKTPDSAMGENRALPGSVKLEMHRALIGCVMKKAMPVLPLAMWTVMATST